MSDRPGTPKYRDIAAAADRSFPTDCVELMIPSNESRPSVIQVKKSSDLAHTALP
jgi:hypothetical protein